MNSVPVRSNLIICSARSAAALLCICAPLSAQTPFGPEPITVAAAETLTQSSDATPPPQGQPEPVSVVDTSKSALPPRERIPLGKPAKTTSLEPAAESPTSSLISLRSAGSLGLVLGLVLVLKFVLTRAAKSSGSFSARLGAGGRAPSGVLEVIGRYPVARGITLVLLRLDRRVLLLSQSPEGFSTLAELTDPEDIASILTKTRDEDGESISSKFTSMLSRFERDHTIIEEPLEIPESPYAAPRTAPLVSDGATQAAEIQTHLARIRELQG